ncbi:MAG TPA: type IV toxin-antitoxin system AbiEi family antitoxin [Verrucomicrobiota bacterium]|nr:type IV toxin-antitoxin system AbiEi family antitoxin [Verrucomicrobiota bacterium]HNU53076.1 type IV toxin-antitoxin system AbiEi family antitoxin [Verrucomicrobiota bacterium]
MSTPETTAFDLVRYAPRVGGIGGVAETLTSLLPLLRPGELRRVLEAEDEPTTAQRLGYLLETLGHAKLAHTVRAWLPARLPVVRLTSSFAPANHFPRNRESGTCRRADVLVERFCQHERNP